MKPRVAILQSNYLPWKGYFDIARSVDLFIFHDDLQYTKDDWRNRNRIKTKDGIKWLTIPAGKSEKRLICEVTLNDSSWQKKHWQQICQAYQRAPYFENYEDFFRDVYLNSKWTSLSELNQHLIVEISKRFLDTKTSFLDSRQFSLEFKKGERVLELLQKANAKTYLSGPAAKDYLNEKDFEEKGIELQYANYSDYPIYEQLHPPFSHAVTILDLLFNCGPRSTDFLKDM